MDDQYRKKPKIRREHHSILLTIRTATKKLKTMSLQGAFFCNVAVSQCARRLLHSVNFVRNDTQQSFFLFEQRPTRCGNARNDNRAVPFDNLSQGGKQTIVTSRRFIISETINSSKYSKILLKKAKGFRSWRLPLFS
jgi:hypothetical protein